MANKVAAVLIDGHPQALPSGDALIDAAGNALLPGYTPENVANKKLDLTDNSDTYYPSQKAVKTAVDAKQATLVSGTNIKTINSTTLLGSGDIPIVGLTDGDKGDITIGSSGTTMTIDNGVVTEAKLSIADNTTGNATTTAHGYLLKATAPASGLLNVVGIANGETAYANKALFDATDPSTQAFGDAAAVGTAMAAARRDHKHAMPSKIRTVLTSDGTYDFDYILSATVDTNGVGVGAVLAIAADGHWDEADADAIANCYGIGIALETGTGTKKIGLFGGQICVTAWNWTVGAPVYLSATQGTMTQTAPTGADDAVIILGFALSADTILFNPYINHITHVGA
jgi:hypothetical protein